MNVEKFVNEKIVVWKEDFKCDVPYFQEEDGSLMYVWFDKPGEYKAQMSGEEITIIIKAKDVSKLLEYVFREKESVVNIDIFAKDCNIIAATVFVNGVLSNTYNKLELDDISFDLTEKMLPGENKVTAYIDTTSGRVEIITGYKYVMKNKEAKLYCSVNKNFIGNYYEVAVATNVEGEIEVVVCGVDGTILYSSPRADIIYPKITSGIKKICIYKKGRVVVTEDVYFPDKKLNYAISGNRVVVDMNDTLVKSISVNGENVDIKSITIDHSSVNLITIELKDGEKYNITI